MAAAEPLNETGIVTKLSPRSVPDTVSLLSEMVRAKGMKLFAVIDQSAEARQIGLQLRDTTLVLFGSPAAGTPVIELVSWIKPARNGCACRKSKAGILVM